MTDENPKIHPAFRTTITGRRVRAEPELQRLPLRTEIGRELQAALSKPPEGYVFVEPDYSAIEIRIYANLVKEGLWEPNSTEETTDSGSTKETPSSG